MTGASFNEIHLDPSRVHEQRHVAWRDVDPESVRGLRALLSASCKALMRALAVAFFDGPEG